MPDTPPNGRRLTSWKDIAAYVERDVRTVMRWEKQWGMPIRRIPGGKRQAVFAYTEEIDQWLNGSAGRIERESEKAPQDIPPVIEPESIQAPHGRPHPRKALLAVVSVILILIAAFGALAIHRPGRRGGQQFSLQSLTTNGTIKRGLVTDGSTIYFAEYVNGRSTLTAIPAEGGRARHIATPFANVVPADISPDGRRLLVFAFEGFEPDWELWILPLTDGTPKRVGSARSVFAAWSPDGKHIAYTTGRSIYLTSDEGLSSRLLKTFANIPEELRWSQDGNRLRLLLRDATTWDTATWELTLNSQMNIEHLSPISLGTGHCDAWSKDLGPSKEFLFSSSGTTLWRAQSAKSWWAKARTCTEIPIGLKRLGALAVGNTSRKGFLLGAASAPICELIRFDPVSKEFSLFLPGVSGIDVDFSRDGESIAYVTRPDFTVWVSKSDGTNARIVINEFSDLELPRWSPDGKWLAFMARTSGTPWRIYVVPSSGGSPREVSKGSEHQGAPTWSPDGKYLVYGEVYCSVHDCDIQRVELATGKVEKIPGSDGLTTARWSPDGRYIAALNTRLHQLLIFNWRTQKWEKIADKITGNDISWSADSRFVYTDRPAEAQPELLRIALHGHKVESVVGLQNPSKLRGRIDTWFSVAPVGSIILLRWLDQTELYALDLNQ